MATVLYKEGETIRVDPKSVQNHLEAGWSLENPARTENLDTQVEEVTEDGESDED